MIGVISDVQWDQLCALIEECWPGKFDEPAANAWRVALADFDAERIGSALRALLYRGATFRPSVSEIIAEIRRDPSKPTFAEAYQLIFGHGGVLAARTTVRKARWDAGERDRLNDEAALERAAELHPLISKFVERQGLQRLRRIAHDDPTYDELRRKDLAAQWEEFCDVEDTRQVAQLVEGDRRAAIGRFDPLRALPAGQAPSRRLVVVE